MKTIRVSQMRDIIILRTRWHATFLCLSSLPDLSVVSVPLDYKVAKGKDWSRAFPPLPGHLKKHAVCLHQSLLIDCLSVASSLHWNSSSSLRKGLPSGVPARGKTTHPSRQFPHSPETLFELALLTGFPFCFLLAFLSFPFEVNKYFKKKESSVALLFCLIYIFRPKDYIFPPKRSCWPSSKNAFLKKKKVYFTCCKYQEILIRMWKFRFCFSLIPFLSF